MFDHVGLRVRDYDKSKAFYVQALEPLGYKIVMEFPGGAGFGTQGKPTFWVGKDDQPPTTGVHIAFASPDRHTVDAFYSAAMAAGGQDNGRPGLRPHYHPDYYGAFVFDPDGNNIEAVSHKPE